MNFNTKKDRRKIKRRVNNVTKKLSKFGFFLDCSNLPAVVTGIGKSYQDLYGCNVEGVSLVHGGGCSCSIMHCAPEPITKSKAIEMANCYRNDGNVEYAIRFNGNTLEEIRKWEKEWDKTYESFTQPISEKSVQQIINENFVG